MKSRLIHLMKISCLMMILIPVQLCTAQSAERSLWVWSNTDAIINDFIESDTIATDWEDFISFCEAPHGDPSDRISTVYMSAFNYMQFHPNKMRTFLADMSSRNFKVFVVLADPEFALPQANQTEREDFKNMIADIIAFEKKGTPEERFAGIMLDIEPHQNSGPNAALDFFTPSGFSIIWETYKTSLTNCQYAVKAYNDSYDPDITWSDAVPLWFSDVTDRDNDGTSEILMNEIIQLENDGFYTVMAYRDSASEIIDVADQEIAAAENAGKQCVIGIETMRLAESDNGTTFWEEGTTALETALDYLNAEYANNDGFGGFSIHMYANGNNDEEAYQHLHTEEATDHAPVINITSPNGVAVDGISYPDDFEIYWTASIPDTSKTCTVEISFKFEEDIDNDSASWHIIDTDSNVSVSETESSCTFKIDKIMDTLGMTEFATTPSNRIIIRAQISYTSGASLTTQDKTNYGIAINEAPTDDTDSWGDSIFINQDGYFQGMQSIRDNDGTIHCVYYKYYGNAPGIFYSRSIDNGQTWSTFNLAPDDLYDTDSKSTWPRIPYFSKNGNFLAIAWCESIARLTKAEVDISGLQCQKLYIMFSKDNGVTWEGLEGASEKEEVSSPSGWGQVNFPHLIIESNGRVHLVFSYFQASPILSTIIVYRSYTYTSNSWSQGNFRYLQATSDLNTIVNTPSIAQTNDGKIICVWGEVDRNASNITTAMRINSVSYSNGNIGVVKTLYTHTYSDNQQLPGSAPYLEYYPVFFPKIIADGNMVYATWQDTDVGEAGSHELEETSNIHFAKMDASSESNQWDLSVDFSPPKDGYAPAMSMHSSQGNNALQIVYSTNLQQYDNDGYIHTGHYINISSTDGGTSWTSPATYIVSGPALSTGIRKPYVNGKVRATHYGSFPFIFSDKNGLTTTCWNDGTNNKYLRIKGDVVLKSPNAPFVDFVDLTEDNKRIITWQAPDTSFAPTGYKIRRIADNDESNAQELNNGDPIYALSFIDNDSMTPDVHYRYQVSYMVNNTQSSWSTSSNAIKDDIYLLLDDFELDTTGTSYTGNQYSTHTDNLTATITDTSSYSGNKSYKITYNVDSDIAGSLVSIVFPTVMDFSNYGSIDLQIKFNPEAGMQERIVRIQLEEAPIDEGESEGFNVGAPIMLKNDGEWHLCHQFLDQISPEVNGLTGATLDLTRIKALKLVTWESPAVPGESGSTSFFVDDIKLNNNPILLIDQEYLTMSEPISHRGMEQGFVINQPQTPVQVLYGNGKIPWYLRIYTNSEILDNDGETHDILKDGLIRYDNESDNDTYYPNFNLPIKVWCKNFGPVGFFDKDTNEIDNDDYSVNGYPPITNRYFFRGYDFNKNKDIFGLLPEGDNQFIESKTPGAGNYPFDLDGDGFMEGDNFFTESARAVIGEEPVWLTIPVKKHPTREMDSDAIVMDPDNDATWRLITDYVKGSEDNHIVELYFAVFMGTDQIMNTKEQQAYGLYRGKIIIDMLFN